MKIWVDKKPAYCESCPFFQVHNNNGHYYLGCCVDRWKKWDMDFLKGLTRMDDCPLQEVEHIDNKTVAIPTPQGKIIQREE